MISLLDKSFSFLMKTTVQFGPCGGDNGCVSNCYFHLPLLYVHVHNSHIYP